jgi:hypothetical protein
VTALRKGGRNSGDSVAARSPARTNTLLHTSADNSGAGSPGSTKVEKEKSKMEKLEMMDSRFRHAGMTIPRSARLRFAQRHALSAWIGIHNASRFSFPLFSVVSGFLCKKGPGINSLPFAIQECSG